MTNHAANSPAGGPDPGKPTPPKRPADIAPVIPGSADDSDEGWERAAGSEDWLHAERPPHWRDD